MVSVDYVNFHGDMDMGGMSPNATSTASAAGASGSAAPKPMSMGGGNCKSEFCVSAPADGSQHAVELDNCTWHPG